MIGAGRKAPVLGTCQNSSFETLLVQDTDKQHALVKKAACICLVLLWSLSHMWLLSS